ncbi:light-harvesting antenna LH1, alpha subunit [Thiorhodospira sibirica]|nr:light-harvesting antenna LH1, alpha subunit [Thiorhodospira sibirica]
MYKMWQTFNPRGTLTALFAFLTLLAFIIHFIVLSTENFNWLAQ